MTRLHALVQRLPQTGSSGLIGSSVHAAMAHLHLAATGEKPGRIKLPYEDEHCSQHYSWFCCGCVGSTLACSGYLAHPFACVGSSGMNVPVGERMREVATTPDSPLDADLVVVDEVSMLDALLANQLVKAVAPGAHLLLVGDPDQLPSV